MKVFTVYDSKAEAFLPPFFTKTTAMAIRTFTSAATSTEHQFFQFGGDYTLFELGEFDERSAKFDMTDAPVNLGTALTYQRSSTDVGN